MHVRPVPKVSIFMALTTKIVTEKAKKWPKMARFWPKSRYNGRVMAREVFFYQCLWVTKFCAKFGCSRTPRTASVPNSFIVLRCMWKEPAPLWQLLLVWAHEGHLWRRPSSSSQTDHHCNRRHGLADRRHGLAGSRARSILEGGRHGHPYLLS